MTQIVKEATAVRSQSRVMQEVHDPQVADVDDFRAVVGVAGSLEEFDIPAPHGWRVCV